MFALPFFRRDLPALKGERVTLQAAGVRRLPRMGGASRSESRAFLEPWEPSWAPDELERARLAPAARAATARISRAARRSPSSSSTTESGKLLGGITLGNIRHGVAQSGHIGYWIGERYAGQGFMVEALDLLAGYAFDTLRLHRIEAACIPGQRSGRSACLKKPDFSAKDCCDPICKINGVWQDHYLYALIAGRSARRQGKGLILAIDFLRSAACRVCPGGGRRCFARPPARSRSSRSRFPATTSRSTCPARSRSTGTRARTSRSRRRPAPTASCAASRSRPTTSARAATGRCSRSPTPPTSSSTG